MSEANPTYIKLVQVNSTGDIYDVVEFLKSKGVKASVVPAVGSQVPPMVSIQDDVQDFIEKQEEKANGTNG